MFSRALKHILLVPALFTLMVLPFSVDAYNFKDNSGIRQVAEGGGYVDSGLENLSVARMIARVITAILGFLGIFFFLLTLYAGLTWMLSRGNSQDIEKAKKTLQNALFGLIIVIVSYSLTSFIMKSILDARQ